MNRQTLLARLDYIFAACCFGLLAAAVTRLQGDLRSWPTLLGIVLPTGFAAGIASSRLIRRKGTAALEGWMIAGVVVPIVAVVGFLEAQFLFMSGSPDRTLYLSAVVFGALYAVPVGLAGHLLLRWWIKSRYGFPDVPTRRRMV